MNYSYLIIISKIGIYLYLNVNKKLHLNNTYIHNSYIHYSVNESLHPINMDFIEKCLNVYYKNQNESSKICTFIQEQRKRNKKKTISLKKKKLSKKQRSKLNP